MAEQKQKKQGKFKLSDKQREGVKLATREFRDGKIPASDLEGHFVRMGLPGDVAKHQAMLAQEGKEQRFIRLALKRVPKAVKAMDAVRVLFASPNYEHTDEHAKKVIVTLGTQMDEIVNAINGTAKAEEAFTL